MQIYMYKLLKQNKFVSQKKKQVKKIGYINYFLNLEMKTIHLYNED